MTAKQFEMVQYYHFVIFEKNSLLWGKSFYIYSKMIKYGSMMELQLEAKVLKKAIFLQWQTKTLENIKVKILY